jgi:hypothetical protein
MGLIITERSLLPVRRDKQIGSSSYGGGGGGGSTSSMGGGGGISAHSALSQLDYASSGHTGFAPSDNPTFTGSVTADNFISGVPVGYLSGIIAISAPFQATSIGVDQSDDLFYPLITNYNVLNGLGYYNMPAFGFMRPTAASNGGSYNGDVVIQNSGDGLATIRWKFKQNGNIITPNGTVALLESPTFTGTIHAPILHSTTILTDHIGEHTGSHTVVFDNAIKGESLESVTAFSAGFAGVGYKVIETGGISSLEVDQLTVRGSLKVYELQINKISSVNGGMIISIANAKCTTVSGTTIYFDEGIGLTIPFVVDDYIKAQQFNGTGVASYLGKVTAVNAGNIVATQIGAGAPWNGMDLVQCGNSNTATYPGRQSAIYLTAADTNNPYISGYTGITDGLFAGHEIFRLGNLAGIHDDNFGGDLTGFGLYAQNVYLTGSVKATELYTGDMNAECLYMNGNQLYEQGTATDSAGIYVNWLGYHHGNTYFRDFIISDGKNQATGVLLYCVGATKRIGIATNSAPDSTFQVATLNGAGLKINYNEGGTNYLYGALTTDSAIIVGGTVTATNFILSSDERLKENIKSISCAMPINIDYKTFNLKSDPSQKRYGVIAQELQKTHPELVRTDSEGMLSVAYIDLLIKEVAYLKDKVAELEGRIR